MNASAPLPEPRAALRRLVDHALFQRLIIVLILLNAISLGLEAVPALDAGLLHALHLFDRFVLWVFVVEMLLRIAAHGRAFFRDPWSLFDLAIVVVALIPPPGPLQVLRALRLLRVLRLVSTVPSLRRVVGGLLGAIPGLASIVVLLMLVIYIASVTATHLFGEIAPEYFGHLGISLFSLFKVMTLEGWPDMADAVMAEQPLAWIFFVGYILVATFMVLNLFIGVVVSAIQREIGEEQAQTAALEVLLGEMAALRREVAELRGELGGRAQRPG